MSRTFVLLLLWSLAFPIWADAPDKTKKTKKAPQPYAVEDVLQSESARSFQFAPDGQKVVWVKRAPDVEKNEAVDHLVLTHVAKNRDIPLTRGEHSCTMPRWAPNGERIAFLSPRPPPKSKDADDEEKDESRTRLWLIDPLGGEPYLLTGYARDIRTFAWLDDDTILFVAQEKPSAWEKERKDKKDEAETVDDETREPPVRLFRVDLEDKKPIRFSSNVDRIQYLSVAPDGKHAVTIHERSLTYAFDNKIRPLVVLHDLETRKEKVIFAERSSYVSQVHWQPDGKGFYAVSQYTTHPHFLNAYIYRLHHYDLAKNQATLVELDWDKGLAGDDDVSATDDGFVTLLADGVRHQPARYVRTGATWKRHALEGEHVGNIYNLTVHKSGKQIVYLHTKAAGPHQWHHAGLEREKITQPKQAFQLAPDLSEKRLAKTEVVRWKGAQGAEVEGILYYPLEYETGKKYPLLVQIHGGPAWADFDVFDNSWAYPPQIFAGKGAFVFQPNYHGSTHYGLKFAESIADGKYYTLPVADIETGIDSLIAKGLVEKDRVALAGWSNGAILTMALITRRHYAAAAAGAGGSEWVADWGVCSFGMAFSNYYLGKSPYEDPLLYMKNAPFYDFAKVKTPTLLFHGSEDRDVPSHHGWLQFRALQQLGKADTRFLLFPGEKHSLKKLSHQERKLREEIAWLDKYLFRKPGAEEPAFKPTSPLASLLARNAARRQGGLLGDVHPGGILIPEVAKAGELEVGRFEVTRAQYRQFDKTYAVDPGTENFPASGITFAQARDYCAWLSKLTAKTYRLGTSEEMEELFAPEGTENTLDFWAGYAINPDDRVRLRGKLGELAGQAPLLKEVGSFPLRSKETPLFDLGGNVAEWVTTAKAGKALGGSADRAADDPSPAAAAYIGFRVVRMK